MTQTGGGSAGDSPLFHLFFQIFKFRRYRFLRPAEPYAPGFGCRYALGLAAADIFSFVLGNEGKTLQHNVCDKGAHQVSASSGVQKGHVQFHYLDILLFGEKVPLMKHFLVIAAQPVFRKDVKNIAFSELPHHFLVLGTVKILS